MQYVDSSALAKLYVREADSDAALSLLNADTEWVTAAHGEIEVRRVLAIRLTPRAAGLAKRRFARDWQRMAVVALDASTCALAADLAEATGARTLDALHLAAAQRAGAPSLRVVTFDVRLAQTARSLGWTTAGA